MEDSSGTVVLEIFRKKNLPTLYYRIHTKIQLTSSQQRKLKYFVLLKHYLFFETQFFYRRLNSLHPASENGGKDMVQLYEKGYGKDAAGIAMEAINYARDARVDVVLVDTAGRMQVKTLTVKHIVSCNKII